MGLLLILAYPYLHSMLLSLKERMRHYIRLGGGMRSPKNRLRITFGILITFVIVTGLHYVTEEYDLPYRITSPILNSGGDGATRLDLIKAVKRMAELPCDVSKLARYEREIGPDINSFQEDGSLRATSEELKNYLQVDENEIRKLRKLHEKVIRRIPLKLKNKEFNGRGIVMSADGVYFPSALATIKWIRSRGYQIPIELFIGRRNSWERACDDLLPSINVKCKCLEDLYGKYFKTLGSSGGFLYKPLSILMSDFDEIYWTDPDSLPLVDVEEQLKEPLFQQIGYIFTSDYWPRTTSPHFYNITNLKLGPDDYGSGKKLRQIDRENAISGMSSESGQFYVKKSTHFRSLVLSLYYSVKGEIWWPLLSQGAPGEGDKEVWPAAAQVLGESWYQTHTKPLEAGYNEKGEVHGFCMVQPDFVRDHEIHFHARDHLPIKFMAAHFNMLKLNVQRTLGENDEAIPQARFLGSLSTFQQATNLTGDIELEIWKASRDSACDWVVEKDLVPINWGDMSSASRYCEALRERVEFLINNPEISAPPGTEP